MCRHYGVNRATVESRLKAGMNLHDALTKPSMMQEVHDHKGNSYKYLKEMLRHYGISEKTFYTRKAKGWSLERILTEPTNHMRGVNVMGTQYTSIREAVRNVGSVVTIMAVEARTRHGIDFLVASICPDRIRINHIGLDGVTYYKVEKHKKLMTTRDIISEYRPDLLSRYDTWNPKDLYVLNRSEVIE